MMDSALGWHFARKFSANERTIPDMSAAEKMPDPPQMRGSNHRLPERRSEHRT
jgi:hypothetical protein